MKHYSEIINDLSSIDLEVVKIKGGKQYINVPCSFDIETTSTYVEGQKTAFMYIWQFGILNENYVYYGRSWKEFNELLNILHNKLSLSKDRILICYVHNLSFEYQFIRKLLTWLSVFSVEERKPLKALCDLGVEFRCSYILSGYNLDLVAKNLVHHKIKKLVGNLDYSLVRTEYTELSKEEIDYCKNDVVIILYYIDEQIDQYDNISKIPLTNTGRVRKYVRNQCYYTSNNHRKASKGKYERYRKIMLDLTIEPEEYLQLKRCFQGGFTHANANYTGKILDNITSIDFTSSYPAVMLSEKFPMGKGVKIDNKQFKEDYTKNIYLFMFDVIFTGLESKIQQENYISESKCKLKKAVINNGRVYSAEELTTTITNIDFEIIKKCYTWTSCKIGNIYRYCKQYLPKAIIESVLDLYEKKTTLKGVQGKETEYLLSKGMLNSIYGMSVTDIVKDESLYDNEQEWYTSPVDLVETIDNYNKSKNRFLSYVWGVFVTAYARKNLWSGIINIGNDYVYSDTDSIKFKNLDSHQDYINWYNDIIYHKLCDMCDYHKINYSRLNPKTIKGEQKLIGIWDFEGTYSRFKTLGAKRYLTESDNQLHLTCAGLSKKNGLNYMLEKCENDNTRVFNMFNDELYIPAGNTGKMTHTYIDFEQEFTIQDYQGHKTNINVLSGVHLENCDFTLSISAQYSEFINNFINGYFYKGLDFK